MGFGFYITGIISVITFGFLALNCWENFGSHAQVLPDDEVKTLQTIFTKLNFRSVQVDQNSCTDRAWTNMITSSTGSNITCDCTFSSNTICHVTNILLKSLNLVGSIPEEFVNLTFLQELDLTRNVINGSIPKNFATLKNFTKLLLLGNNLSGTIPPEIGDIATLEELVLEDNKLVGPLPENLGNLKNLRRMLLSANNFIGSIPESFGNLKNLTDFRIDGSNLTGKIPDFIGNWTKLDKLHLQGTSMKGPIPSSISLLTNLTELRISDLRGSSSPFPNLRDMKKMLRLMLRNCLIHGTIPVYIGDMAELKILDLSFNQLTGRIPGTLQNLKAIDFMFLTNNSLTGTVPDWIRNSDKNLDLSYNNFTEPFTFTCRENKVNLLSIFASLGNTSNSWCLEKDLTCPEEANHHSLFINCGGSETTFDDKKYEEDLNPMGQSNFALVAKRWGYSSSGVFLGNESSLYTSTNQYRLNISGAAYYQNARLSPQSLRYYGLCMRKGSYTVKLHFAEIMYTNDQTYRSLGTRRFDVLIQGTEYLKDFDIMEEAGGAGIGITKEFNNISVTGSTLEIHLYWAGKGTTAIPDRGVYGPLISAITVTPNFKVDTGDRWLSAGAIVGIAAASCVVFILLLLFVLRKMGILGGKRPRRQR